MKVFIFIFSFIFLLSSGCKKKKEESQALKTIEDVTQKVEKRIEGPVAIVNGVEISFKIFNEEIENLTQGGTRKIKEDMLKRFKKQILNRLIEEELIRQEIKKANISVAEEDINNALTEYKSRFQSEEHFNRYLNQAKIPIERIKEKLKEKIVLEKYFENLHQLDVSEEEVKKFYEEHLDLYTEKEMVHAKHILIALSENPTKEEEEKVKKKIEDVKKALKKEEFEEVAKKYSDDPGSKERGGDLGFFTKGTMVKEFSDTAFSLQKGEKTKEPVKTKFGYHFIKVIDKKEKAVKSLEEVKEDIKKSIKNRKFYRARTNLLEKLENEGKIERLLVLDK